MYDIGQYKKPEKCVVDIAAWSRRGNFEFFRDFINPNLGVTLMQRLRQKAFRFF